MKKYELTLTTRNDNGQFEVKSLDKIEADSIFQLLTQFNFVVARALKVEHEHEIKVLKEQFLDDDIPF